MISALILIGLYLVLVGFLGSGIAGALFLFTRFAAITLRIFLGSAVIGGIGAFLVIGATAFGVIGSYP